MYAGVGKSTYSCFFTLKCSSNMPSTFMPELSKGHFASAGAFVAYMLALLLPVSAFCYKTKNVLKNGREIEARTRRPFFWWVSECLAKGRRRRIDVLNKWWATLAKEECPPQKSHLLALRYFRTPALTLFRRKLTIRICLQGKKKSTWRHLALLSVHESIKSDFIVPMPWFLRTYENTNSRLPTKKQRGINKPPPSPHVSGASNRERPYLLPFSPSLCYWATQFCLG